MRIIKKGKLPEIKEKREVCHKCKTVFTYLPNDVKPDTRDGSYVVCPVCKAFISAD